MYVHVSEADTHFIHQQVHVCVTFKFYDTMWYAVSLAVKTYMHPD